MQNDIPGKVFEFEFNRSQRRIFSCLDFGGVNPKLYVFFQAAVEVAFCCSHLYACAFVGGYALVV